MQFIMPPVGAYTSTPKILPNPRNAERHQSRGDAPAVVAFVPPGNTLKFYGLPGRWI